jgi:hypothetical protein
MLSPSFFVKSMVVFIDDFSTQTSQEEHLEMFKACFQRCREVGISLNPEKVYLAVVQGIVGICYF